MWLLVVLFSVEIVHVGNIICIGNRLGSILNWEKNRDLKCVFGW